MKQRDLRHDERGSVSIWAILMVAAFTLIVGISVDLTGQIAAKQRATDIATQAARIAGQQVEPDTVMNGTPSVAVNPARARQAALDYIAGAGMTGAVTLEAGGTQLLITTTAQYRPVFLSSIGVGTLTVTGTSTARLVRAQDGSER
jgi:Flp pilus assembly protein TadG